MLDRIAEWILAAASLVPNVFGSDPHHFSAIRAMIAILLIVFLVYLIAMRPFRSAITRFVNWVRRQVTPTP